MTDNIVWLDFNDAADPREDPALDTEALRAALLDRLEAVLQELFPQGRIRGNRFYVGDLNGSPGKSLVVELEGPRQGLWKDFATDEGGDVIEPTAFCTKLNPVFPSGSALQSIPCW